MRAVERRKRDQVEQVDDEPEIGERQPVGVAGDEADEQAHERQD